MGAYIYVIPAHPAGHGVWVSRTRLWVMGQYVQSHSVALGPVGVARGRSGSLGVARGRSWSLVVIRGHSWSFVVIRGRRGHSGSLGVSKVVFGRTDV